MPLKLYVNKPGPIAEKVKTIFGVDEKMTNVNLVAFEIEGGIITPEELPEIDEKTRNLINIVDTSKPVIISGRGPHWLYGVLVHNLHFARILATWEPRLKKGIVIEGPTKKVGMGLNITGELEEVDLGAEGKAEITSEVVGSKNILTVKIVGDRFINPSELRNLKLPDIDMRKPLIISGLMPIWMGQHLVAQYVHKTPAIAFYDPRIGKGVIFATHSPEYKVGQLISTEAETSKKQKLNTLENS